MTRETSNNSLERYFVREQMTAEKKTAFKNFENALEDAIAVLADIVTYDEFEEYFEDMRIIDLW